MARHPDNTGELTTFYSYGEVQQSRQAEIFKVLQNPRVSLQSIQVDEIAKAVAHEMKAAVIDKVNRFRST